MAVQEKPKQVNCKPTLHLGLDVICYLDKITGFSEAQCLVCTSVKWSRAMEFLGSFQQYQKALQKHMWYKLVGKENCRFAKYP